MARGGVGPAGGPRGHRGDRRVGRRPAPDLPQCGRSTSPTPRASTNSGGDDRRSPKRRSCGPRRGRDSAPLSNAGWRRSPSRAAGPSTGSASSPPSSISPSARSGNDDIRLYQAHASAKYAGITNYEQPIHLDRNHSWLPAGSESPWWNLEGFLYLTDVTEEDNPTRLVSVRDTGHIDNPYGVLMPKTNPEVYAAERPAPGVRGSYLAYRSNTYHRGAPFGSGTGARVVLAIAFKNAAVEWIGYDTQQNRSTGNEVDRIRRGLDATRSGAVRLARTGPPRVERAPARTDPGALSRTRPRPVAGVAVTTPPGRRAGSPGSGGAAILKLTR